MANTYHQQSIIDECENNLYAFATYLNPYYMYGDIHEEVFSWLGDGDSALRQLLLLPRGHLKSHCIAVFCVWKVTYEPWTTIVYLSSQDDLAKAQLYAMKTMMQSNRYKILWPEMFSEEKGEKGTWSAYAFDVDHPARKDRGIRDHTVLVKTVKSNAQGLHCDGLVGDDVVVPQFADTEVGRKELSNSLGYFSSILNPGGWMKYVGTRYHPRDAYDSMIKAKVQIWDSEKQDYVGERPVWDVKERVVESSPDRSGTGQFLWPKTESPLDPGKSYGFDIEELAKIRADYVSHGSLTHYYAQYYNDPNDVGTQRIDRGLFQYYDRKHITIDGTTVKHRNNRLNVTCAMDVAWSESSGADYTAIAVIGVDSEGFIYVLDLIRFKTSKFQEYYDAAVSLQQQWGFRKMLVESNAGGNFVAQEIEALVRRNGGNLVVDRRPSTWRQGSKQEKWAAILEPRYESRTIYHFKGGVTPYYEEEVLTAKPRHDDLKDAVTAAISISKPPAARKIIDYDEINNNVVSLNKRFGGRRRIKHA